MADPMQLLDMARRLDVDGLAAAFSEMHERGDNPGTAIKHAAQASARAGKDPEPANWVLVDVLELWLEWRTLMDQALALRQRIDRVRAGRRAGA